MFTIKKHYFDCIDEKGNAIIIYYANLFLLGLKIPYSSYFISFENSVKELSCLQKTIFLEQSPQKISLKNPQKIFGIWTKIDEGFKEILFTAKSKKLVWDCHHPKANVSIQSNFFQCKGFGYAETLHIEILPWKLPISNLKWGRFLSENNTIVWIEWLGKRPLKKVFFNGKIVDNVVITDKKIMFKDMDSELIFKNPQIIKDEPLLKIANKFPFLKYLFSQNFLKTQERKYTSLSIFKHKGKEDFGWSLYETVLWKN